MSRNHRTRQDKSDSGSALTDGAQFPGAAIQGKRGRSLIAQPIARIMGDVLQGGWQTIEAHGLGENHALGPANVVLGIL